MNGDTRRTSSNMGVSIVQLYLDEHRVRASDTEPEYNASNWRGGDPFALYHGRSPEHITNGPPFP